MSTDQSGSVNALYFVNQLTNVDIEIEFESFAFMNNIIYMLIGCEVLFTLVSSFSIVVIQQYRVYLIGHFFVCPSTNSLKINIVPICLGDFHNQHKKLDMLKKYMTT